jgi:hypothetical protein
MPTHQSLGHGRSAYASLAASTRIFTSTGPALSALYETLVHWFNQDCLNTAPAFLMGVLTHQQEYTKNTGSRQTKSESRINQKKKAAESTRKILARPARLPLTMAGHLKMTPSNRDGELWAGSAICSLSAFRIEASARSKAQLAPGLFGEAKVERTGARDRARRRGICPIRQKT